MDTVLAEFNRRKSEHNHTGRVIDTNFQSVIYEINFSQVALIIDFWFFPHFATFYLIKWAFLLMTSQLFHSSHLMITWAYSALYGNTGCWVFKRGIQNYKDFCLKINMPKWNSWVLRIGIMASCQKLGIILVI